MAMTCDHPGCSQPAMRVHLLVHTRLDRAIRHDDIEHVEFVDLAGDLCERHRGDLLAVLHTTLKEEKTGDV
ncbi:hypothetical protein [Oceanicola sp. 22II-s10i]|uniref:hypothetical protein n=1 Tax=Oceanicola sp. 22II-s10i TaxID=1317116 RepID=UPI0011324634|nr:hypothetical protein [Oceanicola sp. 22II-s10i]